MPSYIAYPQPVLMDGSDDYKAECYFTMTTEAATDTGIDISIPMSYSLHCNGLQQIIKDGKAEIIVRVVCPKTFYRTIIHVNSGEEEGSVLITVPKKNLIESLIIETYVVASKEIPHFSLPDFNPDIIGTGDDFPIRKGDILAKAKDLNIKLKSILKGDAASVLQIRGTDSVKHATVSIPDKNASGDYADYIYVDIPVEEYNEYARLRRNPQYQRILQSLYALPALVEALGYLQADEEDYEGTLWKESITISIEKHKIDMDNPNLCLLETANIILDDVLHDSVNDLTNLNTEVQIRRRELSE